MSQPMDTPGERQSREADVTAAAERQREVDHLLHSGVVREHTQAYNLLAYLGRQSVDGTAQHLKEYVIGVEALHKPHGYDPRLDPTVRVEVAKLRKKLEDYYAGPGRGRPAKIVIPKGGYLPMWIHEPAAAPGRGRRRFATIASLCGLALLAMVLAYRRAPASSGTTGEIEAFWAAHMKGSTPTLLVYGTPLFVKLNGAYFRDPRVNTPEEAAAADKVDRVVQALRPRESRAAFTFTGVGEAEGLFLLTRVLASHQVAVDVQNSLSLNWEDMKGKHVVLLGGRKYNRLIPEVPFKPKFEAVSRAIVNLQPAQGEPAEYTTASKTPHGEITEEYALVSVYPGLTPGTRLVILDSSSTEGTLAAAEFITRRDTLRELVNRRLPLIPEQDRVRPFQVVVSARFSKGVPMDLAYVTHAVLPHR